MIPWSRPVRRAAMAIAISIALGAVRLEAQDPGMISEDHPLVHRYPGAEIQGGWGSQREFDDYELLTGKLVGETYTKSLPLQGRVTEFPYTNPPGRSVLEIYTNYEQALRKAGFEVLYSCKDAACGEGSPKAGMGRQGWWDASYLRRYLAARLRRAEGDVYVALNVQAQAADAPGTHYLAIIETKPMATGLVVVNAKYLADELARTGHVAVYAIYFDTGKWDVKPQSEAALREVQRLLANDPTLRLFVVGHTDSVGSFESNRDLSSRRAAAIVDALVKTYGVAAARLRAEGVSSLAPVASNATEEGRAKNRRVELVKQ